MKVAIIGSRDYPDLDAVRAYVAKLRSDTEVVTGGALPKPTQPIQDTVDLIAERAAKELGFRVKVFRPDYNRYGPHAAPLVRNGDIVAYCDELVAFWYGNTGGTADAIRKAKKAGKLRQVFHLPPTPVIVQGALL